VKSVESVVTKMKTRTKAGVNESKDAFCCIAQKCITSRTEELGFIVTNYKDTDTIRHYLFGFIREDSRNGYFALVGVTVR
jgi:hypothetical protein